MNYAALLIVMGPFMLQTPVFAFPTPQNQEDRWLNPNSREDKQMIYFNILSQQQIGCKVGGSQAHEERKQEEGSSASGTAGSGSDYGKAKSSSKKESNRSSGGPTHDSRELSEDDQQGTAGTGPKLKDRY